MSDGSLEARFVVLVPCSNEESSVKEVDFVEILSKLMVNL